MTSQPQNTESKSSETRFVSHLETEIGGLKITTSGDAVLSVEFEREAVAVVSDSFGEGEAQEIDYEGFPVIMKECRRQLGEYFMGQRKEFSLNLEMKGTDFQKKAWEALLTIPYGRTVSYGEQAKRLGKPGSSRAVGGANHHNPIVIIIPCHRVIGANGSLTGFGAGLWRKEWLLSHEQKNLKNFKEL